MHLMSCEHPIRVYNKYIDKWIWTPCKKCNSCLNRRAKYWTDACERERAVSAFTMFVTLTYDELSLPVYNCTGGFDELGNISAELHYLWSTRLHDEECIELSKDLFDTDADKELFDYFLKNKGIPYASKSDIQLFHKRLNKWFFDNVTHKYKNFRFFIVSELGSTTLRPHFHALYFIDDKEVAERFSDGLFSCWKFGRLDCQYVENSACSYVAQYINKLQDCPSFYKASPIRPFFLSSRCPLVGNRTKYAQSDEEIFDKCAVQTFTYSRKDAKYVLTELDQSTQNRLFPKCFGYGSLDSSLRAQLYAISSRFRSRTFKGFQERIRSFIYGNDKYHVELNGIGYEEYISTLWSYDQSFKETSFLLLLRKYCDNFSDTGVNWLRRVYYLSRKVLRNAMRFGVSFYAYLQKIDEYWNKYEIFLLKKFYTFQEDYLSQRENDVSDLALMYPEFIWNSGLTIGDYLSQYTPHDVIVQRKDAAYFAYSNKRTHYKNLYLDSLKDKDNKFYVQLKRFYYAKKCNEIFEALSA